MLTLLRNPAYLKLWLAQIISQLGDGITKLLIVYLAAQLSDNPIVISFVILAQVIPSTLFGSFVGPFIDRYSKKNLMIGSDVYRAIIVLLMIPSQHSLPLLLILVFFEGIGSIVFDPARASIIPRIVGEANITQSISLSQATMTAMRMIGPAIGGILIGFHHFSVIFVITVFTFLVSALFILFIPNAQEINKPNSGSAKSKVKASYKESLKEGFSIVFSNQGLLALIILLFPAMFAIGIVNSSLDATLLYVFKVSPEHFGFIETTFGIGSLFGAIGASMLIKRLLPRSLMLGALMSIGVMCILILPVATLHKMFGLTPIYGWAVIIGFAVAFINVPLSSLFIILTPDHARGRSSSIFNSVANSAFIIGLLVGGWMASAIGVLYSLAAAGIMLIIVTIVFPMLKYYRALKNIEQDAKEGQSVAASV